MNLPRRLAAAGLGALLSVVPAATGGARWTGAGTGAGTGTTGTLAAPTRLTVTKPSNTTAGVAWTGSTAPNGGAVTGYYVTRLTGSVSAPACGTSPTNLTTATSCDDTGLTTGTYTYTVTAVYRTWTAVSAASSAVTIAGDTTPPVVSNIALADATPSSTNGTLRWTVTFSEAVSGVSTTDFVTVAGSGLGGTPVVTAVSGSGAVYTVTASSGWGSGTLGLSLVDDDSITDGAGQKLGGAGAGNGTSTGPLYALDRIISTVSLVNGGTAGVVDRGDQIVVRFSRAMKWSTICGSWLEFAGQWYDLNAFTGDGTRVTVRVSGSGLGNGAANDVLTVTTGNCTGALRFGSINLGSPGFVSGTRNFSSSPMTFNTSTQTLTIRLGTPDQSGGTGSVSSTAPTYTADGGITDSNAVAVNNSPFALSPQMWF